MKLCSRLACVQKCQKGNFVPTFVHDCSYPYKKRTNWTYLWTLNLLKDSPPTYLQCDRLRHLQPPQNLDRSKITGKGSFQNAKAPGNSSGKTFMKRIISDRYKLDASWAVNFVWFTFGQQTVELTREQHHVCNSVACTKNPQRFHIFWGCPKGKQKPGPWVIKKFKYPASPRLRRAQKAGFLPEWGMSTAGIDWCIYLLGA